MGIELAQHGPARPRAADRPLASRAPRRANDHRAHAHEPLERPRGLLQRRRRGLDHPAPPVPPLDARPGAGTRPPAPLPPGHAAPLLEQQLHRARRRHHPRLASQCGGASSTATSPARSTSTTPPTATAARRSPSSRIPCTRCAAGGVRDKFGAHGKVTTDYWGEVWTDGGLATTPSDLARFGNALYAGPLLPPSWVAKCFPMARTAGASELRQAGARHQVVRARRLVRRLSDRELDRSQARADDRRLHQSRRREDRRGAPVKGRRGGLSSLTRTSRA